MDDVVHDLDRLGQQFEAHRRQLKAVAYRMLGSMTDADDAVQEAWLRLARSGDDGVDNLGAWLTTVVGRICLDMLRTRQSRREDSWETRMPDPMVSLADDSDPQQQALLADSVGMALLVVLDTLSPKERLVFVLHDMFAVPFSEIGPVVGRSPNAAKQLASRARRRVQGGTPELDPDPRRQREVVDAFLSASRGGSLSDLLAVLDPAVVLRADFGGPLKVARGAQLVAEQALLFAQFARFAEPALVNGAWGLVTVREGEPVSVMAVTVRAGQIAELNILADPARLQRLGLPAVRPQREPLPETDAVGLAEQVTPNADPQPMPPGSDPEVDLVLASYAAFARGDIAAAVAPLTEETEWVEPEDFPMGGRRVGRAAVAQYLTASRASWRELTSTPTAYRVDGRIVVVHAVSGSLLDGSAAAAEVADVFTVRGGEVVAMHATTDVGAALGPR